MNKRNLAYIALLAVWLCFSYWLYADRIGPRIHQHQETSWPAYSEDLPYPLAYLWASDIPIAGDGFGELKAIIEKIDSTEEILLIRGFYFMDELDSINQLDELAHHRIDHFLQYVDISEKKIVREVSVQPVRADVKSNPFEAIRFERLRYSELINSRQDTFEVCFPLKDSLRLPQICTDSLVSWIKHKINDDSGQLHIIGTADGSGVAESSDVALERAWYVKEQLLNNGWEEVQLVLSSGQRNHPHTLRNRCVIVYFE